jgi:hypothetical protein
MTADDWVKVIGAIAAGVVFIIGAVARNYMAIKELSRRVDGRLDELVASSRREGHAEGMLNRPSERDPNATSL